jgi:hypothetical protein
MTPITSLRLATRRATVLTIPSKIRQSVILTRKLAYHGGQEPYDPETDPTPRRRYIFGGAALIGIGTMLVLSIIRPAKSDTDDSAYRSNVYCYFCSVRELLTARFDPFAVHRFANYYLTVGPFRRSGHRCIFSDNITVARCTPFDLIGTRRTDRVVFGLQGIQCWFLRRPKLK